MRTLGGPSTALGADDMGMSVTKTKSVNRTRLRAGVLAAVVGLGGAVVATAGIGAEAATPAGGTVNDANKSTSWTGGPFAAPNTTGGALDAPDCSAPESCDDFALKVDTPSTYGSTHKLEVSVRWPNTAADFDLYLLNAAGSIVASSASSADPELVVADPKAGTYTVRVVPYAPLGDSYQAKATLTSTPTDPTPGTVTPPKFRNYPAPRALVDPNEAGEPSIGANFNTDATLYQAYLKTLKVTFDRQGDATWSDVSANATTGCPQGSTESLDPILFTDSSTGRTFESQLSGSDSLTCYTDDDGKTWNPSTGGGVPSGVDHQTIGGGHYTPDAIGTLPTTDYPDVAYYCSQDIATAFCAASNDGGMTFGAGVPTYDTTQCGGLHGHVKVAPDGTAYLPNKSCGATAAVAVSTDNGMSWQVKKVPGTTPGDSDPSVGIGRNGTTYFGYVGADGAPGVATSTTKGDTWRNLQPVGADLGVKNAVFPTMVAGDDNRAAYAYLGTTTGGNYQDINTFHGVWHLYVSTTYDGGKTWQTRNATGADPVQRGSICTGGTTCGNDRNLLDFIDVTIDDHGRVEVGYADGCINACVTSDAESDNGRNAYATIARQSTGKTLFAKYDDKGAARARRTNLKMRGYSVVRSDPRHYTAMVTIDNTGQRTVSSRLKLTDNGRTVRLTKRTRFPSREKHTFTLTWKIDRSQPRHVIVATIDPANKIRERFEADNSKHRMRRAAAGGR